MPETTNVLSVAGDFSRTPGARYRRHGPHSGQQFLEDKLEPAFRRAVEGKATLTVVLDGALGYATSFLEEAFGGLVRAGWDKGVVHKHLIVVSNEEPELVDEIRQYVDEA